MIIDEEYFEEVLEFIREINKTSLKDIKIKKENGSIFSLENELVEEALMTGLTNFYCLKNLFER